MKKLVLKNDRYKRNRGGDSRLLRISCQTCDAEICTYQKDGPGSLRRMYVDRMIDPKVSLAGKNLVCANNHLVGIAMVYAKENRPAFRLMNDSVRKKIVK